MPFDKPKTDLSPTSHYPNRPVVAVGAVVFHEKHVLLVQRRRPPSENLWAIPGGKVELGETLQQAVEREVLEETGLTVRAGNPVHVFELVDRDKKDRIRFHYVIVDLEADFISGDLTPDDDALDARWVTAEEFRQLHVTPPTRDLLIDQFEFK